MDSHYLKRNDVRLLVSIFLALLGSIEIYVVRFSNNRRSGAAGQRTCENVLRIWAAGPVGAPVQFLK